MTQQILLSAALSLGLGCAAIWGQSQPRTFFKDHAGLTDADIQKIQQGQVITRVLSSTDKYGMLVFGAVYINAPMEKFASSFRDVKILKQNKVYLDVQEFSPGGAPPKTSDFDRLVLDKKDIDQLRNCKQGECDLQVFDDLTAFQKKVDWSSPNRYVQANSILRQRVTDGLTQYMTGGLKSFGSYRDREKPFNLYQATKDMVDGSYYLPKDKAAGVLRHVTEYPNGKVAGAEDFFYWEKIDFGQEPTARINHVSIFPKGFGAVKLLIANKQLYASRYMRVALQMFYCLPDSENPGKPGFYLIEMNDSRLPDFGGLKLAVVRKVATGKALEATKDTLTMFYNRLNGK
ncbi:MAG: hypothetical protein ABIZ80_15745 [Bryobacteraceae bacterium]